jgi:hypothetical protein
MVFCQMNNLEHSPSFYGDKKRDVYYRESDIVTPTLISEIKYILSLQTTFLYHLYFA